MALTGELFQQGVVFNRDVLAFHRQHTGLLKTPQQAADGFNRQAQVITDIATRHSEAEFAL